MAPLLPWGFPEHTFLDIIRLQRERYANFGLHQVMIATL